MNTCQYIGSQIRKFRKQKDWTQEHLAFLMRVSKNTISNWEKGKTKIQVEQLGKLAGLFGVDVRELYPPQETCAGDMVVREAAEPQRVNGVDNAELKAQIAVMGNLLHQMSAKIE